MANYGFAFNLLNYFLDIAIGIAITHFYRFMVLELKWNALTLPLLFRRIIPSIIVLSVVFMFLNNLKWHYYRVWILGKDVELLTTLLTWDPILITGLRTMSIWVLAYHLYHYYQKEIAIAKLNAELSIIAKQAQLDNLAVQLNPHFLFNSLNSIKSLVLEKPEKARRAVDLLSDILRSSLYENDALVTIKNELNLVKDYIELEKMRFEERLHTAITIDSALENHLILPLSIQLLVENAIKHGIDKRMHGGTIVLSITKTNGYLQIVVQNPGQLVDRDSNTGLGIKNLSKRLQIQYNGKATLTLNNETAAIVTATLLIPLQAHE